jgi:hypothetical protein
MKNLILIIIMFISNLCFSQIGINTLTPKSTLDINGNVSYKVISLNGGPSGSATVIDDGYYINAQPTASNVEFILPDAATVPGRTYVIRNISNSEIAKIYSFGGSFFAGNSISAAATPIIMDTNNTTKTLVFYSDGVNWTYGPFGW